MSRNSGVTRSGNLDSLPSWISDHLGQGSSYMADEVSQSPSSPVEGSPEENPLIAIHPSIEEKTNIMTIEEWNALTYFFPLEVRARLPDEGETITSTRPGEVAFYEAAFPAGLRFPLHNTIRLILQFYNICPASSACPTRGEALLALWHCGGSTNILSPCSSLGTFLASVAILNRTKAGYILRRGTRRFCSEDTPATSRGGRASSSSSPAMNGRFLQERLQWAPQEFRGRGGFQSVKKSGRFSVPVLLESKSFGRVFGSPKSRTSRTENDNLPSGEAPSSSSDVGESENPHDQARRESLSRDDSIECLGSIRTDFRRLLPHIPDLTLLRWLGGKVLDPILDRSSNAPSSNSLSESCSDSSLPVELESDAMPKRVSFKKIGEKLGKTAGASSGTPAPAKGVVIGDKRPGESITSSPSKKGKADDGSKGKGPSVAEKLLRGVIPPANKEKVEKLTLDQTATKLFHVIGQALVLGLSLAVRSREAGELTSLQEGRAASMETEIARLQKVAADLDQQLAESRAREQQANDELAKAKSDRDLLSDQCGRSGVLVNELREALNKSKDSAVEEFKSSSEFMVAVEDAASKYFGEGFNFCKVQLRRHHPDLAIDLEGTVVDQDLLTELDEADEENEKTGEK
ncbi:hypothetical protein Acr_27g0007930 [Actinidia rufa]|uniref:Uncharacterized protein n=1 Tax=Actinidia rufa TaxID=165716 RepID=A0A7J0H8F1_9ERIC|nr:hypothetical protein Acr_27g0007930 [Actinidia rufa]